MNFNINLPFVDLKFINSQKKHETFFKNLLFNSSLKTKNYFFIEVRFVKKIKSTNCLNIEDNCIASNKDFIVLDTRSNRCKLNFSSFTKKRIYIEIENDFDLYYFFTFLLEPLIIIWSSYHKILYLHASGISKNKKITLFPAWRNTGKTNTILDLCRKGFDFCGDDFCVIKDGKGYLYPKFLNLFSYNLKAFPDVYNHISFETALRLKITSFLKKQLFNLSQLFSGSLSKVLYRVSQLAEVSTNIKLEPNQLNITVCEKGIIKEIYLLQKSDFKKQVNKKLPFSHAKNKIFYTIKYELKDFNEIYLKYRYLFPETRNLIIENFDNNYKKLISKNFSIFKIRYLRKGNQ